MRLLFQHLVSVSYALGTRLHPLRPSLQEYETLWIEREVEKKNPEFLLSL